VFLPEDAYRTVSKVGKAEIEIKGSRFIAHALPASTVEEAEEKIEALRQHYHDATHNCYAYRIGTGPDLVYRFDDAGEPGGTAGRPILQAIEGKGLTDVAVVVTRYFGGTKLGAGGLVRAYSTAAAAALEAAEPVVRYFEDTFRVSFPYPFYNSVQQTLDQFGARVVRSAFAEKVTLVVAVRSSNLEDLLRALRDATAGKLERIG